MMRRQSALNAAAREGAHNMSDSSTPSPANQDSTLTQSVQLQWPVAERHRMYFLSSGLLFLVASLCLYLLAGYMVYSLREYSIRGLEDTGSRQLSDREVFNAVLQLLTIYLGPLFSLISAFICTRVGVRLLRSSGAVTTPVIAPQDYPVLGAAIAQANADAITQYIRLSSLTGITGTFTKVGMTGLPLATIFLTVFLALAGLVNAQFFDLAKLTLGAFLGSFVQRQSDLQKST